MKSRQEKQFGDYNRRDKILENIFSNFCNFIYQNGGEVVQNINTRI